MKKIIAFDIRNVVAKVDNKRYFSEIIEKYGANSDFCEQITKDHVWLDLGEVVIRYDKAINNYESKILNILN